jgi:hypothetical protein
MTTPTTVPVRLQLRADTAANWTNNNPILLANELGRETDTGKIKIGNGTSTWTSLAYQAWATLPIAVNAGGTGQTSYTNGQLLIGNTTGNTLTKATLTAGSGVAITNGTGSITISATGSGGTVTDVTATSPLASTGGNTPDISIQDGTTAQKGAVQLEDSTTSSSTTTAATPASVKAAFDLADAALPKAGGTLTGDVTLDNQSDLRFGEATANGTNYVAFQAPASIAADVTWTLPDVDGSAGESLTTDGAGVLGWSAPAIADGSITDAKIASNAAIAGTKISPDFGSQNVVTTGNLQGASINGGPLAGFRNAIINGNFDVWQRGTSFTGSEYGADRWLSSRSGSTHTVTRQPFTLGQTDVPSQPTYYIQTIVSSVAGASNNSALNQRFEDVRTFAGQQVTLSFWAKADASKNIAVEFVQNFGTGGSPSAGVQGISVTKVALTTSWQKITVTTTLPSISGKTLGTDENSSLRLIIYFDAGSDFDTRTDTLGQQSGTFDIAQVQIEAGPVATPFERRSIGTELALCQRYFQTMTAASLSCQTFKYMAGARTGSFAGGGTFSPQMRTAPSVTTAFTTLTNCTEGTHNITSTGIGINADVTGAGNYRLTGGNITFDAEL